MMEDLEGEDCETEVVSNHNFNFNLIRAKNIS